MFGAKPRKVNSMNNQERPYLGGRSSRRWYSYISLSATQYRLRNRFRWVGPTMWYPIRSKWEKKLPLLLRLLLFINENLNKEGEDNKWGSRWFFCLYHNICYRCCVLTQVMYVSLAFLVKDFAGANWERERQTQTTKSGWCCWCCWS